MWVPSEIREEIITITPIVRIMMNIKEGEEKGLDKGLGEVVLEEHVSKVEKKSIEPLSVHNVKEEQTKEMKAMDELHMQTKKIDLNITMMQKGERP